VRRESAKKKDVRTSNIEAAKAVADSVRTSLGPRGMDKMVNFLLCFVTTYLSVLLQAGDVVVQCRSSSQMGRC
jgi:hypothetical protein